LIEANGHAADVGVERKVRHDALQIRAEERSRQAHPVEGVAKGLDLVQRCVRGGPCEQVRAHPTRIEDRDVGPGSGSLGIGDKVTQRELASLQIGHRLGDPGDDLSQTRSDNGSRGPNERVDGRHPRQRVGHYRAHLGGGAARRRIRSDREIDHCDRPASRSRLNDRDATYLRVDDVVRMSRYDRVHWLGQLVRHVDRLAAALLGPVE
jgi:hypothetical protein